jgi:hypothetical protein
VQPAATELREGALAHGTLDEVVRIICPPIKRKRGRQLGSRSEVLAIRRDALWRAYQDERMKSPNATEVDYPGSILAWKQHVGRSFESYPGTVALVAPRPRLMGALICHNLRRRVRHLKVSFHHTHDANSERAANNKECQIPSHRCSLLGISELRRHSGHGCDRRHETSLLSRSDVPPYSPKRRHFRRLLTA